VSAPAPILDLFHPPFGLVTPPECLLARQGVFRPNCYLYNAANCFDLARDCYRAGQFHDAIALLDHAIRQNPQACYFYLKAMSQFQLGWCHEAVESVQHMIAAQHAHRDLGLSATMERFNGPLRGRIDDIVKSLEPNR
jgi:hypothetical protein